MTWVVLGLIAQKPCSGYDIKRNVDLSIRHFWAASYGQIYPELKRLEEAGWIIGDQVPRGGRARSVYRITGTGSDALRAWFSARETRIELRDESLLRLFFADTLPLEKALGQLAARREGYRQMLDYLESLDDGTEPDTPFV
ncbi:MAG: PadR family transcriptional regulator, partial [Gaiellales bacterium]